MHARLKERLLELCIDYLHSIEDINPILSDLFKNSPALQGRRMNIQTFEGVWNNSDDSNIDFIVNYLLYKEACMTKSTDQACKQLCNGIKSFFDDYVHDDGNDGINIIYGYSFGRINENPARPTVCRIYAIGTDQKPYRPHYLKDIHGNVFLDNNFDNPPEFSID